MKIICIGVTLRAPGVELVTFDSPRSLLDADLLIVDPASYVADSLVASAKPIRAQEVGAFRENIKRRGREILDFLEHGRPLIYFPVPTCEFRFISHDGYHRSDEQNDPLLSVPLPMQIGTSIELIPGHHQAIGKFFEEAKRLLQYRTVIDIETGSPFLAIKGTSKAVARIQWDDVAKLILLPALHIKNTSDEIVFVESLQRLVVGLNAPDSKFALPDWHEDYRLVGETAALEAITVLTFQIAELGEKLTSANADLEIIQAYKTIFAANDQPLVSSVADVLRDLGFTVDAGPPGRDDLVAQYNGRDMVIEVKGRESKGAGEKDAAQLEKWVSRFIDEKDTAPKAMLVVNGYKDSPLQERTEPVFPHQMLAYSLKRDHCLISAIQLLCLHQSVQRKEISATEAAQSLFDTVGVYPRFNGDEWKQLLSFDGKKKAKVAPAR